MSGIRRWCEECQAFTDSRMSTEATEICAACYPTDEAWEAAYYAEDDWDEEDE